MPRKKLKEFDVHFSLNGFFRRMVAKNEEEAMATAEAWLKDVLPDIEKHARTGLGVEVTEACDPVTMNSQNIQASIKPKRDAKSRLINGR